jgi:hypothetical protein
MPPGKRSSALWTLWFPRLRHALLALRVLIAGVAPRGHIWKLVHLLSRYLTFVNLPTSERNGTSGMRNIFITIAGITINTQSPLSVAELGIEKRLGPFLRPSVDHQEHVSLRWEESLEAPLPHGELIYDPSSIWRMYRSEGDYYAAISYPNNGARRPQGVLRSNATWDMMTLSEQRTGAAWQSLLNSGAGELILRTRILFTGGLVFHAAGIDDNGRGIVYVGHSSAGKSTQAGLWSNVPGVIAMNDDRIAIRMDQGGAVCYGTPWGGDKDIARNHQAPLAVIVLLEQATANSIEPLIPSTAAPLLLARTFLPYWDQRLVQRALANLEALLARVPVYRLRCRPEPSVISLVRSVL